MNRVRWSALVLFCFFPGFLLVYRGCSIRINWNSNWALTCLILSSGVELSEHWNVNETTTQTSKLTLTKQHWGDVHSPESDLNRSPSQPIPFNPLTIASSDFYFDDQYV